jgi:hypothetical protein
MSFSFDPAEGLVIVATKLWGPEGDVVVRLALDTGATTTVVNWETVVLLGYDPSTVETRIQITTGSGIIFAPRISIGRVRALGKERLSFPVLCHTLPPSASVDGLLGLDFFRGERLVLDFQTGTVTLDGAGPTAPRGRSRFGRRGRIAQGKNDQPGRDETTAQSPWPSRASTSSQRLELLLTSVCPQA